MAWKGESRRHSLARRGIRTANGCRKTNSKMLKASGYWVELQFKVPINEDEKFIEDMIEEGFTDIGTDGYYTDPYNFYTVIVRKDLGSEDDKELARKIAKKYKAEMKYQEYKEVFNGMKINTRGLYGTDMKKHWNIIDILEQHPVNNYYHVSAKQNGKPHFTAIDMWVRYNGKGELELAE